MLARPLALFTATLQPTTASALTALAILRVLRLLPVVLMRENPNISLQARSTSRAPGTRNVSQYSNDGERTRTSVTLRIIRRQVRRKAGRQSRSSNRGRSGCGHGSKFFKHKSEHPKPAAETNSGTLSRRGTDSDSTPNTDPGRRWIKPHILADNLDSKLADREVCVGSR